MENDSSVLADDLNMKVYPSVVNGILKNSENSTLCTDHDWNVKWMPHKRTYESLEKCPEEVKIEKCPEEIKIEKCPDEYIQNEIAEVIPPYSYKKAKNGVVQNAKVPKKHNGDVKSNTALSIVNTSGITEQICNSENLYNEFSSVKSTISCQPSLDTVYRSRYGRPQKGPVLSPDMELVPLVRRKSTQQAKSPVVSAQIIKESTSYTSGSIHNESRSMEISHPSPPLVLESKPSPHANHIASKQSASEIGDDSPEKLNQNSKKEVETKWLVGDLLWSKITGHPFWPCMVSYDPVKGIYTKVVQTKFKKPHRLYHVQYFGDEAQHGWTLPFSIMPFEGQAYFDAVVKQIESTSCNKLQKQKLLNKYQVKPSRIPAWDIAVKEAEDALKMTRSQRKQQLTFNYIMDKAKIKNRDKSNSIQLKTPIVQKEGSKPKKVIQNRKKSMNNSKSVNYEINNVQSEKSQSTLQDHKSEKHISQHQAYFKKKSVGNFSAFLQKNVHKVKLEKPNLNDSEIELYLTAQWQKMSEQQKMRYTSRFSSINKETLQNEITQKSSSTKAFNQNLGTVLKQKQELGCKKEDKEELVSEVLTSYELNNVFKTEKNTDYLKDISQNTLTPLEHENIKEVKIHNQNVVNRSTEIVQETLNQKMNGQKMYYIPKSSSTDNENMATLNGLGSVEHNYVQYSSRKASSIEKKMDTVCTTSHQKDKHQNTEYLKITSSDLSHDLEGENTNGIVARQERLCQICENTGDVICCKGPCQQTFHLDCLGLTISPSSFLCDECTTGNHTCFVCKKREGIVKKCSHNTCGKFYHEHCLKRYPLTARVDIRSIMCPLHACLACHIENPKNPRISKSRLLRCIRCPTAYHVGDSCIAAGSVPVASQIICANHFQPRKGKQYQSHINVNWCFICSIGGSLICCDTCPAAFHSECLQIQPPEGSYFCDDCVAGKHPHYGEIIWVKLGCYRWWPAEICHPRSVPLNIQNLPHEIGEFPIQFFGSHDYYWTHRGRVFLFHEGDKGSRESASNKNLAKVFQKALEEANEAFHLWQTKKAAKEAQESERNTKPPPYKHIKVNKPVGKVQIYSSDSSQLNRCDCDPASENPCGSDSDCLNRMMMCECHSSVCKAGDRCQNQRFQKRQYATVVAFKTERRGWGLKALEDVKKGQFVVEYVGELIDEENCQERLKKMQEENDTNFYFLTIDKDRIIDAGPKGNFARFMNHSCQPNCETQKWLVNGDTRVGLFALCDIPSGTELNFNYNLDCRGTEKTKCFCRAPNCSGYIGIRPKSVAVSSHEKKMKETARKKKKRPHPVRVHEDECFRCGEGGELVMCDRKGCPKTYHLNCLNLTKPPHGRWECPWHHCDVCGKPSIILCSLCPNSFCKEHNTEEKVHVCNGIVTCDEHDETDINQSTVAENVINHSQ